MFKAFTSFIDYQLRFTAYFKAQRKEILDQKEWDSSRLQDQQNERFLALFRQALRHSPFYQKRYADYSIGAHSVQSIEDIHRLPIITKDDIRNHREAIYIGHPWVKTRGRTSGSSGTPLTVYRDYLSTVREGAYLWAQRALFGLHPGQKVVSLRGNLDRTVMKRYDRYADCLHLSSYNLREENAQWYYEQIRQFAPYAILAYPSSAEILANWFDDQRFELSIPYVFTSSEQVYEHQRAKVERVFNTKIVDWYGNAERSIALEQRPDGHYYELPLYSVNEYEHNRTLTTGLITSSFPLIRYQVNDVITPQLHREDYRIEAIAGRHDDVLVLPDGTRVGRIGTIFSDVPGLEFAQIYQKTSEKFSVNLVVNEAFTPQSLRAIQSKLQDRAGSQAQYEVAYVQEEDIIRSAAGKFKLVISEVDTNRDNSA